MQMEKKPKDYMCISLKSKIKINKSQKDKPLSLSQFFAEILKFLFFYKNNKNNNNKSSNK